MTASAPHARDSVHAHARDSVHTHARDSVHAPARDSVHARDNKKPPVQRAVFIARSRYISIIGF